MNKVKYHVRKGDTVKVIAGNDKGKTGKVLEVNTSKYRAIVEGANMVTKHINFTILRNKWKQSLLIQQQQ